MLSEKWQNYGDQDHREYGGQFVKYDEKFKELTIVQTSDVSDLEGIGGKYLFESASVSIEDLLADDELAKFADVKEDFDEDTKLIYLITSYIAYHGSDEGGNVINNYWKELRTWDINPSKSRNI